MSETTEIDLIQLPRYACHKIRAALIKRISHRSANCGDRLYLDIEGFHYDVTPDWSAKHSPQEGGYLVIYDDGYRSYSPAKAFLEGYTREVTS